MFRILNFDTREISISTLSDEIFHMGHEVDAVRTLGEALDHIASDTGLLSDAFFLPHCRHRSAPGGLRPNASSRNGLARILCAGLYGMEPHPFTICDGGGVLKTIRTECASFSQTSMATNRTIQQRRNE